MRFVVSSGDLLNRLQIAGRAFASKSPIPILDNYLFTIKGDTLEITASDSDVMIVTSLTISESEHDGRVAIPHDKITDYLKRLPEQPVTFVINDDTYTVEIITTSGKNNQAGLNADEYPTLIRLNDEEQKFNISSDVLLAGINHTLFATSNEEIRPIMCGIFFDIEPDQMTFVASDTHILTRYTRTDAKTGITSSFVLGKKPASLLKNIISAGEVVTLTYDTKSAVFTTDKLTMTCILTEGKYPNYKSVIPSENPFHATVNRSDLANAISRSALFSDINMLVRMNLNSNSINVTAQDLNFACSADETIECQYDGEPMTIGLNSNFCNSILTNFSSKDIMLQVNDPSRAVIVTPTESNEYENELTLIMPLNL